MEFGKLYEWEIILFILLTIQYITVYYCIIFFMSETNTHKNGRAMTKNEMARFIVKIKYGADAFPAKDYPEVKKISRWTKDLVIEVYNSAKEVSEI